MGLAEKGTLEQWLEGDEGPGLADMGAEGSRMRDQAVQGQWEGDYAWCVGRIARRSQVRGERSNGDQIAGGHCRGQLLLHVGWEPRQAFEQRRTIL